MRPPVVTRPHAPLTGEFAAHPATCHQAFQLAVDFGFVAVDAIADFLPEEMSIALVKRAWSSAIAADSYWTATTSPGTP